VTMASRTPPAPEPEVAPTALAPERDTGFLPVIARWWWSLLAGALLAAGVSYAAASTVTPTYEAKARVLVGPVNTDLNTLQAATTMAQTYAQLLEDGQPIEQVSDDIGHGLSGAVQAVADVDTRIITIRVRERDQDEVAEVANALAVALQEFTEEESRGAGAAGEVRLVETAERPSEAFSPRPPLVVPIAGMAGLLLSLAVVLLLEYLGDTFRGTRDLGGMAGSTALGSVDGSEPLTAEEVGTPERLLAVKVAYGGGPDGARRSALVVGVEPGDDQEVPVNVAVAATALGRRVVVLDADWRGTGPTRRFGLHGRPGLADALVGGGDVVAGACRARVAVGPRLEVVPIGGDQGLRMVEPEVAEAVVAGLAEVADLVVVASPPVAEEAAGLVWARAAEGVVLVARPEHTQREAVADAVSGMSTVGATVLGVVLNVSRVARPVRDRHGDEPAGGARGRRRR
jgi:capsular polysaccharide biosynthesis protein